MAAAERTHRAVNVPSEETATSVTVANPSGTFTTRYTEAPTRVFRHGQWEPLNFTLQRAGGRLRPAASTLGASVSNGGTSPIATITDGTRSLGLGWPSALPTPSVSGSTATYPVTASESVQATTTSSGVRADVVLTAPPATAPTYRFPLTATGYTVSTDASGTVSFDDAQGAAYEVMPELMWDAQRDSNGDPSNIADVSTRLVQTAAGPELDVTPSMAYLTAPSTQYPVVIDPTISNSFRHADTYVDSDSPSTVYGGGYNLLVGTSDGGKAESYLDFQTPRFYGQQITNASLTLFQYIAGSCTADPMVVDPLSSPGYSVSTTDWTNRPSANADSRYETTPSFNTGKIGCSPAQPNGPESFDVTKLFAGYASGTLPDFGIDLSLPSAHNTDATYQKGFCSMDPQASGSCSTAADEPTLSVTYTPQMGLSGQYQMTQHRLNDRSTLYINDRSGDAVIDAKDVSIHGVGLDLDIDRFYNSYNTTAGAFGTGWTMSVGPDVQLVRRTSGSSTWFDYQAPSDDTYGTFVQKAGSSTAYDEPTVGGVNANLKYDNTSGDTHYQQYGLTFNSNGETYWFSDLGCSTCNAVMVADVDRNGNSISYTYNNTTRQLTSITDTEGRSLTVHYNSSGYIDLLTDSTGRTWQYTYTGSDLTRYTDPMSKQTNYTYTGNQVTTIVDPMGSDASGDHPTTNLVYTGGQTTKVKYSKDSGVGGVYEFDFTYGDTNGAQTGTVARLGADDNTTNGLSSRCGGTGDHSTDITDVSDPQGGTTTYCFTDPVMGTGSSRYVLQPGKVDVYDGIGNKQTGSYNADDSTTAFTDPMDQGVTGGSTVSTYDSGSGGDSASSSKLESVTAPADPSDTGGTSYFDYNNTAGAPPTDFEPTSEDSATGNCTSTSYDANGNLQDSYTGQTATAGSGTGGQPSCAGQTTGAHNHVQHNSNGTVSYSYSPMGDSATSDRTNYHYLTSGVNTGQLSYSDRPSGNDTCTTTRTLCTNYTYDSLSRISSITNGKGDKTTYHYDNDDRVIEVDLGGDTTCDAGHDDCYTYVYDAEGNLTSVTDNHNTTRTLTYDRLNRQTTETVPGTSSTITTAYDGAGNLTSYAYGTDTVTYTYNAANELTGIKDGGHSTAMTVTPDNDGREQSIALYNGVTISYTYHNNGQIKTISTSGGTGLPATTTYCYVSGCGTGQELPQLQEKQVGSTNTYYAYGNYDRLCWVGTSAPTSGCGSTTGRTYSYSYDTDGNITTKITPTGTTYYGYNLADELCWSGPNTGTAMGSPGCPSTPTGDTTYNNNNAGDSTNTTANPISYNTSDQASALPNSSGTGTTTQTYQDQGNDLRTSVGADTVINGPLGVTGITNATTTVLYTRDPYGNLIDERSTTSGTTTTDYYLRDALGSITSLINSSGADAGDYTYDPYGNLTNTGSLTTTATANPWRYASGYQDTEGDNYYHFGARYYDPTLGRFTQPDSIIGNITTPRTINPYAYTGGDPINSIDPSGRFSFGGVLDDADTLFETTIEPVATSLAFGVYLGSEAIGYGGFAYLALGVPAVGLIAAAGVIAYASYEEGIL